MVIKRNSIAFLIALALVTIVSFSSISRVYASGMSNVPSISHCAVQSVHLNGDNPPTVICLRQEQTTGKISPDTYGTDCTSNALLFQATDSYGTLTICFLGTGFINLTDYTYRFFDLSWNDRPTYYQSGCNRGMFYSDTNGQGTSKGFAQLESGNLGVVQGTLSSVSIVNSTTSC